MRNPSGSGLHLTGGSSPSSRIRPSQACINRKQALTMQAACLTFRARSSSKNLLVQNWVMGPTLAGDKLKRPCIHEDSNWAELARLETLVYQLTRYQACSMCQPIAHNASNHCMS